MLKKLLSLLIFAIFLGGCAGVPIRTHPQFTGYFKGEEEKTVTVAPISIKFYKLTAGGVCEQMDEWDIESDALFKTAIIENLEPSPRIKIKILEENNLTPDLKTFLDEQTGLYRAIAQSVISHTYMPVFTFPLKLKNFDYTLGPDLNRINDYISTDTLLFISGTTTYWTGGRVLLGVCGVLLGAATGVVVLPGDSPDWISVALVDSKTGNVIWFRYLGAPNYQIGDLRNKDGVSKTIKYLFNKIDE